MKDTRSSFLLLLSLLLFLMSFVILCTWGYNTYYKTNDDKKAVAMMNRDSAAIAKVTSQIANATRDSLQKLYVQTINSLGNRLDSTLQYADSLRAPLDAKLNEFFKLKTEIVQILKDKNDNGKLDIAREKIAELQKRVNDLIGHNNEVEEENKRLYAMLSQLSNDPGTAVQPTTTRFVANNKPVPERKKTAENLFLAYDLRLSALMVIEDKELETYEAMQTDKLVGSFIVKNSNTFSNVAEMVIVILQPDGQVLQKSTWESGTFETSEGKKIYSCKMRFDYTKGEPKKLFFSLSGDKYSKGNYTMQIYYNGMLIGKMNKALS